MKKYKAHTLISKTLQQHYNCPTSYKWMYLMQSELFSIMTRISYFWWDDDNICFVLDQCAKLDFYSASSMKQPSTVRRVVPVKTDYPSF